MKRNVIIGLFGLSAAALLGCPVFSGEGGGPTCPQYAGTAGCFCYSPSDCASGYTCNLDNACEPTYGFEGGSSGGDGGDGSGACPGGCKSGEVCALVDGGATCITAPDGSSGGTDGSGDTSPPFTGCTSNASCADAGMGYICIDGTCTAPADQCTDSNQCPNGEQCVDGACAPGCTPGGSDTCPAGYSCSTKGVCVGTTPCGGADGGTTCPTGETCVEQVCVPKCSGGDAACSTGEVCVDNGCIPDQKPVFTCTTDGKVGDDMKGDCDTGSVCLHHSCYLSCTPGSDGGADASSSACSLATGDKFPLCKGVMEGSSTFDVCASSSNLGSQCSPTTPCTTGGEVCIDGYCK